jgi:hypothetical protein
LAASAIHGVAFMYMSYFFRYRRVGALPVLFIAGVYTSIFENLNNILYKVIVDKQVLENARRMGLENHAQPAGTRKARGLNFI